MSRASSFDVAILAINRVGKALQPVQGALDTLSFSLVKMMHVHARKTMTKRAYRRFRGKAKARRREFKIKLHNAMTTLPRFTMKGPLGETYTGGPVSDFRGRTISTSPILAMGYGGEAVIPKSGDAYERFARHERQRQEAKLQGAVTNAVFATYIKTPGE